MWKQPCLGRAPSPPPASLHATIPSFHPVHLLPPQRTGRCRLALSSLGLSHGTWWSLGGTGQKWAGVENAPSGTQPPLLLLPGPQAGPAPSSQSAGASLAAWNLPQGCAQVFASQRDLLSLGFVSVWGWERQVLSSGHIGGLLGSSSPPGSLTRPSPRWQVAALQPAYGTRAFRGPLGPSSSGQCLVQRAVGSVPLQASGVCACVCVRVRVRVSSLACAVNKTCLPPRRSKGLPSPLGSFLSRKLDLGSLLRSPPAPASGLADGLCSLQKEGWLCVEEGCTSTLRKWAGCWAGCRVGHRWKGPPPPPSQARVGRSLAQLPSEYSQAVLSWDPVSHWGVPACKEHLSRWRKGLNQPGCQGPLLPPWVWTRSSGPHSRD